MNSIKGKNEGAVVAILGGVGPMASVDFHRKLVEINSKTGHTDQDYINIVHLSFSTLISDRTLYIKGEINTNPGEEVVYAYLEYISLLSRSYEIVYVVVPCCTFHSTAIVSPLINALSDLWNVEFVSFLSGAQQYLNQYGEKVLGGARKPKVGCMLTDGALLSGVWRDVLHDAEIINIPNNIQRLVHEAIYHPEFGLKSCPSLTHQSEKRIKVALDYFDALEAEIVVLGCSELGIVEKELNSHYDFSFVDPATESAQYILNKVI